VTLGMNVCMCIIFVLIDTSRKTFFVNKYVNISEHVSMWEYVNMGNAWIDCLLDE